SPLTVLPVGAKYWLARGAPALGSAWAVDPVCALTWMRCPARPVADWASSANASTTDPTPCQKMLRIGMHRLAEFSEQRGAVALECDGARLCRALCNNA